MQGFEDHDRSQDTVELLQIDASIIVLVRAGRETRLKHLLKCQQRGLRVLDDVLQRPQGAG